MLLNSKLKEENKKAKIANKKAKKLKENNVGEDASVRPGKNNKEKVKGLGENGRKYLEINLTKDVSINKYKNTILSLDSKIIDITKEGSIESKKEELAI